MDSWRTSGLWLLTAASLALLTLAGLSAQGLPFVPALLCMIALACALHPPTRDRVTEKLMWAFSGSTLRSLMIVSGALMVIQLIPLEMALLLAADVLVYLEAVAALSLMAASARLKPLQTAGRERWRAFIAPVKQRRRDVVRQVRAVRSGRRRPPSEDAAGWAFA